MGVRTYDDLRAWQTARAFKLAIYRLSDEGTLAKDFKLRQQIREAAASAASQIAEGFGRYNPADLLVSWGWRRRHSSKCKTISRMPSIVGISPNRRAKNRRCWLVPHSAMRRRYSNICSRRAPRKMRDEPARSASSVELRTPNP